MEAMNDNPKAVKLVEEARSKSVRSSSCWQNAYENLSASCSEIIADEEKKRRLAWDLSDCFQKESGRQGFPSCDSRSPMKKCLERLDDAAINNIFLDFLLDTNSICHQLQMGAFKHETERLVNGLTKSAQFAEEKLENIEEKAENLMKSSMQIHDTLFSIDFETKRVAQATKNVEENIHVVVKHTDAVQEAFTGITASQMELREGQEKMKGKLDEGIGMLQESHKKFGQEIDNLRVEAVEIGKEIDKVGKSMYFKMENLQNKADDIKDLAGVSLDKQGQLLDSQSLAVEKLQFLSKFQSQALEESRNSLQKLAELSHRQQEELIQRQEQLQQAHDRLVENSKSILAAQEAFESKQASMFLALDKLFVLHNSLVLESRLIKSFFVYSVFIFILYMFTSTKQTYNFRPRLYMVLCITFMVECFVLRFGANEVEFQTWIINLPRLLFVLIASIQLLYAIFTYRDYEMLNHQMLLTLVDKINRLQEQKEILGETESHINWSSWIDTDISEHVDMTEDPDYTFQEEVAENSITTSIRRKYDLRPRRLG